MKFRSLGRSGLRVSLVGVGCNNFGGRIDAEATRAVIHKAVDVGITFFDTADVYGNKGGSEAAMGQVLGDLRKEIVLATKFGLPMDDAQKLRGASRRYIINAVEASLRRLKTDWIDLYQLHKPDPFTPIEETLRALDDLVRSGKVRYIGSSNMAGWQVVEADWIARELGTHAFVSSQNEYSLMERRAERELIPALESYKVGLLPYFPLASGLLTGKYRGNERPEGSRLSKPGPLRDLHLNERNLELAARFCDYAEERGRTPLELAFSWLAAQPAVSSVIAGATRPEQLEQNAKAVEWELSAEELDEVDRITAEFQAPVTSPGH